MRHHVSRTCFHASLKSQTDMSSFRLSCERTLGEFSVCCVYRLNQPFWKIPDIASIIFDGYAIDESNCKNFLRNHAVLGLY